MAMNTALNYDPGRYLSAIPNRLQKDGYANLTTAELK